MGSINDGESPYNEPIYLSCPLCKNKIDIGHLDFKCPSCGTTYTNLNWERYKCYKNCDYEPSSFTCPSCKNQIEFDYIYNHLFGI